MIQAEIFKDASGGYVGFSVSGHAGYDDYGKDIVCAAVSVLTQNTVNSIEKFTEDAFKGEVDEKDGSMGVSLKVTFPEGVGRDSGLLLDSMVLGLESIAEVYGRKYIRVVIRKV